MNRPSWWSPDANLLYALLTSQLAHRLSHAITPEIFNSDELLALRADPRPVFLAVCARFRKQREAGDA